MLSGETGRTCTGAGRGACPPQRFSFGRLGHIHPFIKPPRYRARPPRHGSLKPFSQEDQLRPPAAGQPAAGAARAAPSREAPAAPGAAGAGAGRDTPGRRLAARTVVAAGLFALPRGVTATAAAAASPGLSSPGAPCSPARPSRPGWLQARSPGSGRAARLPVRQQRAAAAAAAAGLGGAQ